MYKINKDILDRLQLSALVFKYPVNDAITKDNFDPNINKDFEEFMVIEKGSGIIRLNKEKTYSIENPDTILNKTDADLLDGTWWVLPKEVRKP